MSKFNKEIKLCLWTGKGNTKDDYRQFYGFSNKTEEKSITYLIDNMMHNNRFEFPVAGLFVRNQLQKTFIQGILSDKFRYGDKFIWYGPEISDYKIKIIDNEGSYHGPFYSNSSITDSKLQLDHLISEYCKYKFRNNFSSAIVMDIRQGKDNIFAKIKLNKQKNMSITFENNN
jgi:hypothetical protein